MAPFRLFASLLGCIAMSFPAVGADTTSTGADEARPRIGLVLAGGGAKGGAHVGVLKVLEELRVPIDCIAGTSMGALIGAGYASGITASDLERFLTGIRWQAVIGSVGQRDLEPIEQKRATVTYTNDMELGIKGGTLVMPGGVIETARIETLLRDYVSQARLLTNFDDLPIPFRAVATDMLRGEMVVLDRGDIASALRASMAIPGAFSPVEFEGKVLADGGMVRNLPVDVARELCADVVIVSDLVEPDMHPEGLRSALQLLLRSTDISIIANEREQLATLTRDDVHITVPTRDIGSASFERLPETFPLGEAAAREAAASLARYAVTEDEYAAWRERTNAGPRRQVRLAEVRFEGLTIVNPAYLAARAQLHPGDVVNIEQISQEALRMAALRDFDSVGYRLAGDPDNPVLEWLPTEKAMAPDYLRFDLGMYSSSGGDLAFVLYGAHTRTWLNRLGGEWRNQLQLGYGNRLETSLFQPLDHAHRWFTEPRLTLQQTTEDFYNRGDRIARYDLRDYGGGVDLGYNFGNYGQLRLGYSYLHRAFEVDTGPADYPEGTRNDAGLTLNLTIDTRDNRFNATRGLAAVLEYSRADDALGGDQAWQRAEVALGSAIPLGGNLIWTTVAAGTDFGGGLPLDRMFTLGGPGSFPGHELGELRSGRYWTVSGSYLHKLADIVALQGQAIYMGVGAHVVRTYEPFDAIADGAIYGASFYLTGRTPVGPATLGLGMTSRDAWSLWIGIGRPVGHGSLLDRSMLR